jgi:hypothetical protein
MKKNSLTTAVVAGVAGVAGLASFANAVNLNPDGLGQVLIYPYYTVNAGQSTLISVVNTTANVKAVKVRFLESLNSREVLDFNLYLSPFDVWTAAVVPDGTTGPGRLITSDTSCTTPSIPAGGVDFRNFAYGAAPNVDDAPNGLARTREGHIEIIEMGEVLETVTAVATGFEAAAIHTAAGTPQNCARLNESWNGLRPAGQNWSVDSSIDVRGPRGGLFGGAIIVNPAAGTALPYNADAINGFYTLDNASLHTRPGSTLPSLAQANTGGGQAVSYVFTDDGQRATLPFVAGRPDAVSAIYMHDAVYNEYNTNAALGASTEWVLTFPTKRLHIEQAAGAIARVRPFFNDSSSGGDALRFDANGYCEPISIAFWDREERTPGALAPILDFSPEPVVPEAPGINLCWEANVITFNQQAAVTAGASSVLGSRNARNVQLASATGTLFTEGWIAMGIGNANNFMLSGSMGDSPRVQLFGLPVTGFSVSNYINGQVAGGNTLANYSVIAKHRASRDIAVVEVGGTENAPIITPSAFSLS